MKIRSIKMDSIAHNLRLIEGRIAEAARRCGRHPEEIRLIAVAKTQAAERVHAAFESGAERIGENYIQEAREKYHILADLPIEWHFIGHLQTNKAKYAVRLFDVIHSVDSLRLAAELDHQARKVTKTQKILIQVNIAAENSKSGVTPAEAPALAGAINRLKNLHLIGLMAMPPFFDEPERARPYFAELRRLRDRIKAEGDAGIDLRELSMGMTGDFEAAIEEGATLVRIGTAIFGERS
jgi:PLP dependent protein